MLVQIKTLLVKLARESCLACLSSLQERISILQERPTELDMFMAYQVGRPSSPDHCLVCRPDALQFTITPACAVLCLFARQPNLVMSAICITVMMLGSAVCHRYMISVSTRS